MVLTVSFNSRQKAKQLQTLKETNFAYESEYMKGIVLKKGLKKVRSTLHKSLNQYKRNENVCQERRNFEKRKQADFLKEIERLEKIWEDIQVTSDGTKENVLPESAGNKFQEQREDTVQMETNVDDVINVMVKDKPNDRVEGKTKNIPANSTVRNLPNISITSRVGISLVRPPLCTLRTTKQNNAQQLALSVEHTQGRNNQSKDPVIVDNTQGHSIEIHPSKSSEETVSKDHPIVKSKNDIHSHCITLTNDETPENNFHFEDDAMPETSFSSEVGQIFGGPQKQFVTSKKNARSPSNIFPNDDSSKLDTEVERIDIEDEDGYLTIDDDIDSDIFIEENISLRRTENQATIFDILSDDDDEYDDDVNPGDTSKQNGTPKHESFSFKQKTMRRDKGSEVSSNEPLTAASQHGLLSTPIQHHYNENTTNMNKNNEMEPTTMQNSPTTATPQGNPKDNRHSPGVLINSAGHFMTDDDPNDTSPSGIRTVDSGGIRTVDSHPQCEVCHLAFMNQKLLNKHKKMHQVREFLTNPFQCKQCKFRTCNQVNLNAHMKRAHLTTRCRGK